MKLKHSYEMMEIDDQIMAVPTDEDSEAEGPRKILKLNKSAAAIFELLMEETTEEMIAKNLLEEYNCPDDELKAYVHEYVEQLIEAGFVE